MTEREQFEVEFVKLNYQWSDANKDKAFLGWQMARAQPAQAEAVPPDVVRVSLETLHDWKDRVNTLATLGAKADRYSFAIKLKQDIAAAAMAQGAKT